MSVSLPVKLRITKKDLRNFYTIYLKNNLSTKAIAWFSYKICVIVLEGLENLKWTQKSPPKITKVNQILAKISYLWKQLPYLF